MESQHKQTQIIDMFNDIAPTYDTTNRLMSMGADIKWRKEACKQALKIVAKPNVNIADIACGTGDMMLHWAKESVGLEIVIDSIVGVDPSNNMLSIAREKIIDGIFITAQADNIPLESNSKDIVSIAYGLRNVVNRRDSLREFYRILKPNGVLVILEFMAQSQKNLPSIFMRLYTKTLLPIVGGIISQNFKAYKYLPKSIDEFITLESLEEELLLHGLLTIFSKNYSANVCSLVIAQKQKK
ncbi:bifunctional demethylmenaquinone methyltransferase/2-methoxy-6-polyprenyl-1,4-benzoquinol methylase UbiE [Helicobacter muridarum]|uniref:Demethylmenaquinone methyltransferase n=1 Tax=Helicobacter muridarum TaxID=216 RepID=A0A099TYA9_9HELI|nr:bifunctional demethylmenaquinone methyltransferase/2-methoxy-6-polyprenyl-1,4-benzoquinol methylase UbiE [Helicobacter muridarum]TLE01655.1 bifunctional demethylmenaquinone methyltransferase/2-methoxy-6-polyprenyl-1,4-benzoquinol methylase UbiE [Helicobacter muridarum]STQ86279.1 ubiquinone/menaquinone biosynthesis methyltransferase [Helicobacter muridarum]